MGEAGVNTFIAREQGGLPPIPGASVSDNFIDQCAVLIHSKRNSIALELRPTQHAINASFNFILE